jgi:hypothetical protein
MDSVPNNPPTKPFVSVFAVLEVGEDEMLGPKRSLLYFIQAVTYDNETKGSGQAKFFRISPLVNC